MKLALIRQAMERIEAGTYGTCTACGNGIPFERLFVFPEAPECAAPEAWARLSRAARDSEGSWRRTSRNLGSSGAQNLASESPGAGRATPSARGHVSSQSPEERSSARPIIKH